MGCIGRKPAKVNFIMRDFVEQRLAEIGIEFAQRDLHIFSHRQCGKQRAALKQYAPPAPNVAGLVLFLTDHAFVENADFTGNGFLKTNDRSHEH